MVLEMETVTTTPRTEDARFTDTYTRVFPVVARFVSKMNGSFQDAKDIFHDALIIFYEKQRQSEAPQYRSEDAYIVGIAKHLWLRKHKADREQVALDTFEATLAIPPDYFLLPEQNKILRILQHTGQRCMNLLQAFYYDKKSMQTIATQFNYTNVRTATVQKFKCLEKVRNLIRQHSIRHEDLID